jgi:hypothetical protein
LILSAFWCILIVPSECWDHSAGLLRLQIQGWLEAAGQSNFENHSS